MFFLSQNKRILIPVIGFFCASLSFQLASEPLELAEVTQQATQKPVAKPVADKSASTDGKKQPTSAAPSASDNQNPESVDLTEALPDHPYELMREMTDRLVKRLERFKTLGSDEEKEAFAQQVVDQTFAVLVDFDLIARRVMAKHYRYASPEQRARFAERFRQSLINTYALGMSAYSDQKITIKPFEGIDESGKRKRAKVEMEVVTSDGERYPIVYSLFETEEGSWKLENLIINSINIGLTFRNQFNEALSTHAGNIDQVIENWDTKI